VDCYEVKEVYAHREVASEEVAEEEAVRSAISVPLRLCEGNSLFHESDLPFSLIDLPDTFTTFRKLVEKRSTVSRALNIPDKLPKAPDGCEPGKLPSFTELGLEKPLEDLRAVIRHTGGETPGLARLQHYLWHSDAIQTYKETRNGMLHTDESSKFSAWLSLGCLSPRRIYYEVRRYEEEVLANQSTYWLIFELLWREFFRWVAARFGDRLFQSGGIRGVAPKTRPNAAWVDAWCAGETGVPFVDAHMRELNATGFMSNRGRQNVASFLVKDLEQDWRVGAEYFESQLIDYDVHSNWGNWNYVAGIGNDPREDRYFNMVSQASRYDPKGEFVIRWVPELRDVPARELPYVVRFHRSQREQYQLGSYPEPLVFPNAWRKSH
jgi:deoxyribodipyrimidine photo-lyase